MRRLSQAKVDDIKTLLRSGRSVRQVSAELHISLAAIDRIRKTDKENIPDPKMGRPKKVCDATIRMLVRQVDTGQLLTLREGQRFVQATDGIQIHVETVRNYVNHGGLNSYIQRKRLYLTKIQKKARVQFAKEHLHWTVEDWKNVMFSDETIISKMGTYGRKVFYSKPENKGKREHHSKGVPQGGGGKIMIWGCITFFGMGDASWIKERINSQVYLDILNSYVLASRDYRGMDRGKFLFQQDNARVHTARIINHFFRTRRIKKLEWPVNSADLNIIEHVWAYIKRALDQYETSPNNLQELWNRVDDIWVSFPIDFIQSIYESLPGRMQKVIELKGAQIN